MYRLNQPKPDIRFNRNGRIDIIDQVVQRMNLGHQNRVSFYVDQEHNLFIRPDTDGLRPSISRGNKCHHPEAALTPKRLPGSDREGRPPGNLQIHCT